MLTKEAKEVLVNLADDLDGRGFGEEATMVDSVIQQDSGLEALIVDERLGYHRNFRNGDI